MSGRCGSEQDAVAVVRQGRRLSENPLYSEAEENRLPGTIRQAADESDVALVDCPGIGNQIMVYTIGAADFVLIPTMVGAAK